MRALIISADLFEDSELKIPYQELINLDIDVDIASLHKGMITGKHGYTINATLGIEEIDPTQYDMLLLPGGKAPTTLRKEPKVLKIVQYFFDHNKLIAAICHGPQLLISAGLMVGKEATGYKSIQNELIEAGAIYRDEEVIVDKNMITSRIPADLDAFMNAIKKYLKESQKHEKVETY